LLQKYNFLAKSCALKFWEKIWQNKLQKIWQKNFREAKKSFWQI
jgi:uncharacterized membrane protein